MILTQPYFLKIYIKIYVVEDPVGILLFDVQEQFFNDSYKFSNFSFLFFFILIEIYYIINDARYLYSHRININHTE